MVKIFDDLGGAPLSLAAFFEQVAEITAPALSESHIAACARALARLGANRNLVWEHVLCSGGLAGWTAAFLPPQSLILGACGTGFLRANVWLPRKHAVFDSYQRDLYAYGYAHNHDFRFLTVGHLGPGYETDLFEIGPDDVTAAPGQRVELCNHRREQLREGRVLYFEPWRDVHVQHEPASLSVSINFIFREPKQKLDQLLFDPATSTAVGIVPPGESSRLITAIEMATLFADETTARLLATVAESHHSAPVRAAAHRALARGSTP